MVILAHIGLAFFSFLFASLGGILHSSLRGKPHPFYTQTGFMWFGSFIYGAICFLLASYLKAVGHAGSVIVIMVVFGILGYARGRVLRSEA